MGPGAIDRIPMQAIVDAHSGELLDKYVNETEEHKEMRAQYHLNTPQIINKLNDPLIEEYQPEAYNKIKIMLKNILMHFQKMMVKLTKD